MKILKSDNFLENPVKKFLQTKSKEESEELQKNSILENATEEQFYEDDPAVLVAQKTFGVKYLFAWQRLVISNILDSFYDFCAENSLQNEKKSALQIKIENNFEKNEEFSRPNFFPKTSGKNLKNQKNPENPSDEEPEIPASKNLNSENPKVAMGKNLNSENSENPENSENNHAENFNAENFPSDEILENPSGENFKKSNENPATTNEILENFENPATTQKNPENSCETDVFCRGRQIVLLPTGAGKSMCFLVPSILLPGPTLVIYPLLALMNDQMKKMEKNGVPCVVFKGGQSENEREENFKRLLNAENPAKVILANPEVLQNENLVLRLSKLHISHIAIDEAHCVSEWGDSFRPAYLTLGKIIKKLGVKLVTAFTATASEQILCRISEILFDGNAHLVQSASDRPNIHYEVQYAYAKIPALIKICAKENRPAIVFCATRKRAEQTSAILRECFGKEKVKFYHAGLERIEKKSCEDWFLQSTDGILCATCAFGMGVDKSDVKTVIHLDCPEHLENFIQEAGRAGRDGSAVKSILLWNHADSVFHRHTKPKSRERASGDFALLNGCRRQFLLDYLGAEKTVCSGCDFCDATRAGKKIDFKAEDAKIVLDFVKKNRRVYSLGELVAELIEIFNERDLETIKIRFWTARDISELLSQMISEKSLIICSGFWSGKIDLEMQNIFLRIMPKKFIHLLHFVRRRFHSVSALVHNAVQSFLPLVLSTFWNNLRHMKQNLQKVQTQKKLKSSSC